MRDLSATLDYFHEHGWVRLAAAFDPEAAAAMREVAWQGLGDAGIDRDDRSTWTTDRPSHLQGLRDHPVFREVATPPVLAAIEKLMAGQTYPKPKNPGALFIAMPVGEAWRLPSAGWHIDANYAGPLNPPGGVKTFALLGDVEPRSGATLVVSGSHRFVHRWFSDNPPPVGAKSPEMRKSLIAHPWFRDLQAEGDAEERIERFMNQAENSGDIALQVVELTGRAGDVFLLHPLTMHAAAPNAGSAPRFLLSGGVTSDMWGWQGA